MNNLNQAAGRVLLLGEFATGSSHLLSHLEQHGCHCWFATSAEQGILLFNKFKIHLILGTSPMQQTTRMISLLGRSSCNVFYALAVEDGCWWLPLMTGGQKCLGALAVRPREFIGVLDQTLKGIRPNYFAAAPKRIQRVAFGNARALKVAS